MLTEEKAEGVGSGDEEVDLFPSWEFPDLGAHGFGQNRRMGSALDAHEGGSSLDAYDE
jgi:hypothetical protein